MKILFKLMFALFIVVLFTLQVHAEELYKLGAVNAIRVLEQSPQAGVAKKLIEKEFSPRDKQLVAKQKKLKLLEDKLSKDGAIMSEQERTKLERNIISMRRDLKRNQDEFREDLSFRRNEEFGKIQKDVIKAIQQVAKDNNYDVVLSEGVIYASPRIDISTQVIEYLKKNANGKSQ